MWSTLLLDVVDTEACFFWIVAVEVHAFEFFDCIFTVWYVCVLSVDYGGSSILLIESVDVQLWDLASSDRFGPCFGVCPLLQRPMRHALLILMHRHDLLKVGTIVAVSLHLVKPSQQMNFITC